MSETIRARIKALLAKTKARGCTEAEALAAAAKAAELMAKYQISETALDMACERESLANKGSLHFQHVVSTIAACTNCVAIFVHEGGGVAIEFHGREPGPQIALYLRDVCQRAMKHEAAAFRKTPFYRARRNSATRGKAVSDFSYGLALRLRQRLSVLFYTSISAADTALATTHVAQTYPNTTQSRKSSSEYKTRFDDARWAGWKAGDKIGLNHGVDGSADVKRLGVPS